MAQKKLEAEIARLKKELSRDLPAEVKTSLEKALAKAEDLLKKGAVELELPNKKPPAKKKESVRSAIDDCKEILAQHKREKTKAAVRRERRQKAGKPPELTVPETIKKTARAVEKKVEKRQDEDRELTDAEAKAIYKNLLDVVRPILESLPKKKRVHFGELLVTAINTYIYDGIPLTAAAKAEDGMRLNPAPGEMQIFHYPTQHFSTSQAATDYFDRLLKSAAADSQKNLIMAMAKDVDNLLGKARTAALGEKMSKASFLYATGHLMRAVYWSYGITEGIVEGVGGDPQMWYPGFLASEMYTVADHLEQSAAAEPPAAVPEPPSEQDVVESDDEPGPEPEPFKEGGKITGKEIKVQVKGTELNVDIHAYHQVQTGIVKELKAGHRSHDEMKKHIRQCFEDHVSFAEGTSDADKQKVIEHFTVDTLGKAHGFAGLFKEGGKITFNDKVKAIAASLEGKPVPKKYQKKEGRRFGKKTATEAARRIVGKRQQQELAKRRRELYKK